MHNVESFTDENVLAVIGRIKAAYSKYFRRDISEKDISLHLTGTNPKLIANWKTTKTVPSQKYVMQCAQETNISVDYLLFGIEPKTKVTIEKKKEIIESMVNHHIICEKYSVNMADVESCEVMLDEILEKLGIEVEQSSLENNNFSNIKSA